MKKWLVPLLAAMVMLFGVSLAAVAGGNVFRFEKKPNFVFAGETVQLELTREGAPAEGEITFAARNGKIASVDQNGLVTGLAKGQTDIIATARTAQRNFTTQIRITVGRKAEAVSINESGLPVYPAEDPAVSGLLSPGGESLPVLVVPVNKQVNLRTAVLPRDATYQKVVLTTDDPSVARIQRTGLLGVSAGETVLTAANEQSPEIAVRYRVLVVQPVTKLTVEADTATVAAGGQIALRAAVTPENATITEVEWSSGNENIATVDENGTVTGVKAGTARILAAAADGSGVRANYMVKVVQNPTGIQVNTDRLTVDVGRTAAIRATVSPMNAFNKKVIWSSSDESVATVSAAGRITALSLGQCVITARSEALDTVSASVAVTVQQPVKRVSFVGTEAFAYSGETLQLEWRVEPADATNPALSFTSSNRKVLTVDENGLVSAVSRGVAFVNAVTTDGSNRKARIRVSVGQHVTGVEMVRRNAYLDRRETQTAGATIYPRDATNKNMTWTSSDESVVTVRGKTNSKIRLTGENFGTATVTGVTEDGGFETSIQVHVGTYTRNVIFRDMDYDMNGNFFLSVRNKTDVTLTRITAEVEMFTWEEGSLVPASINTRNGSNKVEVVWTGNLAPGETTGSRHWKMVNYRAPEGGVRNTTGTVTLTSYQIDNDWIKTIPTGSRSSMNY